MKKFLIATAALMAGTAALAQTQPVAPAPPAPLAPMQHPMHDRVMTRTEVVTMVRDHFGRLDTDKNGSITTQEAMSVHERMGDRMKMRRFDHGEGGERVMRYERRDPKEAFDRLDANKDGVISRDEFGKGQQERFEKRVEIREKVSKARKDGKLGDRREFRMHHGGMMGGRMIVMADSNHDGQITLAEAEAMALQHFDQMDTNHDGQVTPDERRAGRNFMIKRVEDKKSAG